jgi:hypothetical protein
MQALYIRAFIKVHKYIILRAFLSIQTLHLFIIASFKFVYCLNLQCQRYFKNMFLLAWQNLNQLNSKLKKLL